MKICYVSPTSTEGNALAVHTTEVVTELSKIAEVHLVAAQYPKGCNNLTVHELGKCNIPSLALPRFMVKAAVFLANFLRRQKVDVLYARDALNAFGPILIGKLYKKPTIYEVNGVLEEIKYKRPEKRFANLLDRLCIIPLVSPFYKFNARYASHIIAVTENIKGILVNAYKVEPSRVTVIPNGANTELFKPMPLTEARQKLELDQEYSYICFVGALVVWQGLGTVIRSAKLVLESCANARFLIVGDGPMKGELINLCKEGMVSDKFIFTGRVPYKQVPLYINASDICVAPFIRERNERAGVSPLKIYEYAACGKPIVTSRLAGLEFIQQSNAGILVEPENPHELSEAIVKLLKKDEQLREQMGKNGREYVVENYSWEGVAKKVAEVCERTLREHREAT